MGKWLRDVVVSGLWAGLWTTALVAAITGASMLLDAESTLYSAFMLALILLPLPCLLIFWAVIFIRKGAP